MKCSIIGSGCSALSCGIMLAQRGYKVTLFEQSSTIAPTLHGFFRKNRYYETGVHSLGGIQTGEPLHNYLRFLGIQDNVEIEVNTASPFIFSSPWGTWSLPQGYTAIESDLIKKFPKEAQSIQRFLCLVQRLSNDFQYGNTPQKADAVEADKPLQQVLDEFFISSQLMWQLTALFSLFCGLGTTESSLGFYASSAGTYFHSSGTLKGGGKALVNALCARLVELGGTICSNSFVTQIHVDDVKKCTGISTEDGQFHPSDSVIATCHPVYLNTLLPEGSLRQIRKKYYQNLTSTHSFVALYGHVPCSLNLPQSGIICEHDTPIYTMDSSGAQPESSPPIMFFTQHDNIGDVSDVKRITISIIAPTPFEKWSIFAKETSFARKAGYKEYKEQVAQQILSKVGAFYPEICKYIEIDSMSSPLTMRDYCNMPRGAIYGSKATCTIQQPLPLLPIKNLFLSGQALVGPGVLGAMTSAAMTVENILLEPDFAKEIHSAA